MLPSILLALLVSSPSPCLAASAPPAPALALAEDEEVQDKRPEIEEKLDRLKEHVDERGDEDTQAVTLIDELVIEFKRSGPKDRADIVKGVSKCLEKKRKELSEGVPNNLLYVAAATALGEMGPDATEAISKWIGNKKHRSNRALQRALILSLGKTKDVKAVDDLLDLLNDKDNTLIAAAAEALGEFGKAPQKVRKEIFNDLLKILVTTKALADSDINDIPMRDRWDVISAPITTTLQTLTKEKITDPEEWQRWWNKNKKGDWGDPEEGGED